MAGALHVLGEGSSAQLAYAMGATVVLAPVVKGTSPPTLLQVPVPIGVPGPLPLT